MCLVADNTAAPAGEPDADSAERQEPDYRFTFANERTFLAWQRTALGLLAAAVALVQLVPELTIPGARRALGVGLAALAILTSGMGLLRWQQADRAMRRGDPLPRHPSPIYLAVGLSLVGIIALGLVIAKAVLG
jgi:putative membrane protein